MGPREGMISGMDPFTGGRDRGDASPAGRSVVVENLTRTFGPVTALSQLNVEILSTHPASPHGG